MEKSRPGNDICIEDLKYYVVLNRKKQYYTYVNEWGHTSF